MSVTECPMLYKMIRVKRRAVGGSRAASCLINFSYVEKTPEVKMGEISKTKMQIKMHSKELD